MAFCGECGTDIGAAKFCFNCGASNLLKNEENKPSELPKENTKEKQEERELAQFTDGFKCQIRLTTERIYAKSVGLEETYALRSVDGIGVYDDLESYKEEKLQAEKLAEGLRALAYISYSFGIVLILIGLYALSLKEDTLILSIIALGLGSLFIYGGYNQMEKSKLEISKPTLKSYVKIIISGNNKLYLFNKKAKDAANVAEFVNKVEDTLTKYV